MGKGVIDISDYNFKLPPGEAPAKVWLEEKKCPVCGKIFFPTRLWVYKLGDKLVCSYKSMRKGENK